MGSSSLTAGFQRCGNACAPAEFKLPPARSLGKRGGTLKHLEQLPLLSRGCGFCRGTSPVTSPLHERQRLRVQGGVRGRNDHSTLLCVVTGNVGDHSAGGFNDRHERGDVVWL